MFEAVADLSTKRTSVTSKIIVCVSTTRIQSIDITSLFSKGRWLWPFGPPLRVPVCMAVAHTLIYAERGYTCSDVSAC